MKLSGNRCQCPTCGEYFNGLAGFDAHRIGEYAKAGQPNTRRCLTVADMTARGWFRNDAGFWVTDSHAQRAARHPAGGVPAPRSTGAMVQWHPVPDALQSRAGVP